MPPFPYAVAVIVPAAGQATTPSLLIGLNIRLIVEQDSAEYIAETEV